VKHPLVSIVVNNFNYARYLPRSIDGALAQTHPATEVVVVDDASVDGSQDIIRGYGRRVTAVLHERNRGQAAAINAGFRASHGEIVVFLDADDYLYPHAIARVVAAWAPGISKVQYRLDLVDGGGGKLDLFPAPEVRFDSGDVVPRLLATGRYEGAVTSGNAFARGVLEKVIPIPEDDFRISADGYLVTVTPFHGPVVSIDEPLGAYRMHGDNAWTLNRSGLSEHLHRSLEHDRRKYRALAAKAEERGLVMRRAPGTRDHQHLTSRLASLCLDRASHPYASDRRGALALRGAVWSCDARLPWKRRATLAAWFVAVGFLPRPLAVRAVRWRLAQASRPPGADRVLKAVRRWLR
jgi:Glycosyl transferase family 2